MLLVASPGGHLRQLAALRDVWPRERRRWVTLPTPDARAELAGEAVDFGHGPTNRSLGRLGRNFAFAARVLARHRPRTVVTTGAAIGVPFCWLGRVAGARIVYIECLSRVDTPSLTGRLVYPVAHRFFVQWPELRRHYPRAEHAGTLL